MVVIKPSGKFATWMWICWFMAYALTIIFVLDMWGAILVTVLVFFFSLLIGDSLVVNENEDKAGK